MSTAVIPLGDRDHRNTLSWFFRRTLPFGKTHFSQDISEGRVVKAIYITTGSFDMDGKPLSRIRTKVSYVTPMPLSLMTGMT